MLTKLPALRRLAGPVSLLESFCCGALTAALLLVWLSLCGTSSAAVIALVTAGTIATAALALLQLAASTMLQRSAIRILNRVLVLAIIPLSLPVTAMLLNETLALSAGAFAGSSATALTLAMLPSAVVLCICLTPVALLMSEDRRSGRISEPVSFTCGLTVPLVVSASGISTSTGTTALCLFVAVWSGLSRLMHPENVRTPAPTLAQWPFGNSVTPILHTLGCGVLAGALFQISQFLVAADVMMNLLAIGLVLTAVATCSRFRHRATLTAVMLLLLCGALTPAVRNFESLSIMLIPGSPDSGSLNTLLHGVLTIAAVLLPAAAGFGLLLSNQSLPGTFRMAILSTGVLCGLILLSSGISPWHLLATFPLLTIPQLSTALRKIISRPHLQMGSATATAAAFTVSLALLPAPNTAHSTRVAFSPRTQLAAARGFAPALFPVTDPARLITSSSTNLAEYSVWNQSGHIREFRTNGRSPAYISLHTDTSPQPAQEILPIITALCNHPLASQIVIAGDDSSAGLRTASTFPVRSITAIRTDSALTALVRSELTGAGQRSPFEDERVRLIHAPPAIALRRLAPRSFDAAVINTGPDSSSRLGEYLSVESCQLLNNALSTDGLLVFRLHSSRIGAETILRSISTLRAVFHQAGAIQLTPDEVLLLASNRSSGLISEHFFRNLQKQHVRAELSSAGWDWSSISVLALLDANDPIGMFSESPMPVPICSHEPWMLTGYQLERMSARDLKQELREDLAPHQMQIASAVSVGDDHREAQRRLASLAQQKEILAGLPDQPWTYRKSLRMEMQRSPRPPLEEFADGRMQRRTHPLDQLRQDYFVQLGKALDSVRSDASSVQQTIQGLEEFADSGEPLLARFAHHEIVRLYELAGHPDPASELRHRLHLAFSADETDASVRTTVAALAQLNEQPELLSQQTVRFDQMNSLLQELIERWEARTRWDPVSAERVQADIDETVRVCQQALDHLENLAADLKMNDRLMPLRRQYMNQALIVPLRNYRQQVLRHQTAGTRPSDRADGELPALVQPQEILSTN